MANSAWPGFLREAWPTWLEATQTPYSGYGDNDDLQFSLAVGEGGRWLGFVNTGWYYHANREQYKFAQLGEITVTGSAGSGVVNESVSFRPAWGPVLLTGVTSGEPFTRHHNSFYPGAILTWTAFATGSGLGLYTATLPSSSMLVGMRNLTNLPLGSVAGTGLIISENLYYYDVNTGKVYIKPADASNIKAWADLVYTSPNLRMREVVIQESSGVRASYKNIESILVSRGNQIVSVSGVVTGGFFTHSATGVNTGDWVIIDYLIRKSFVTKDHRTIHYYTTASSGENFTAHYETTVPDTIPALSLGASGAFYSGSLDLNPINSHAHRVGYLFHSVPTVPASSLWSVSEILVFLDKPEACGGWGEYFSASAICIGDNGLPVPWAPITVTVSAGASALYPAPLQNRVDGKGEWHALVRTASGAGTMTLYVVSGATSGFASGSIITPSTKIPAIIYSGGFVNLVISDRRTQKGYQKSYVNSTYLDGVPRPATIVLRSKISTTIDANSSLNYGTATITTLQSGSNINAVQEFGYLPLDGDKVVAYTGNGQSPILEVFE